MSKIACMVMLATSAMAGGSPFTDKAIPSMASTGAMAATSAAIPASELPEDKRTVALVIGIAAVVVTFHRVLFRRRQSF